MIKLIVAVDQGNAIGWSDGRLPWKVPADMARFKRLTTGGVVVMGFNTFRSLNRPTGLPNRKNIVLTRKAWSEAREFFADDSDIDIISSLDWVARAEQRGGIVQSKDTWIIGGASVYEEALRLNIVDEIYLTLVHENSGADVRLTTDMTAWKLWLLRQPERWVLCEMEEVVGSPSCTFITMKRIKNEADPTSHS